MNKKKKIIIFSCLGALIAIIGIVSLVLVLNKKETEYVTVSFDSKGGSSVESKTLVKGSELGELESSKLENYTFLSWCYDENLTITAYENDTILEDTVLYASFKENVKESKTNIDTEVYESDVDGNYILSLSSSEEITKDNLDEFLTITSVNGDVPKEFNVTKDENNYLISPSSNYQAGYRYIFEVSDKASFTNYDKEVEKLTVRIHKDEVNEATVNSEIKYIAYSDMNQIDEAGLNFCVSKELVENKDLKVGDTIMLGDGTSNMTDDIRFVNVSEINDMGALYTITVEDSELEDIFDEIDVYYTEDITNEFISNLDEEELAEKARNSESFTKINQMVATTLLSSETFRKLYLGDSDDEEDEFDPCDFQSNASLKDTAKELSIELMDDVKITVKMGDAENDNFPEWSANPKYWFGVTFTFEYDGEIKDNVKINATFEFTEYLNVSLQGYFEGDKISNIKFDYAVNIYTQTEVTFKTLICSKEKDDEEDEWFNITDEIEEIFNEDEEQDSLMAELQEMLDDDGDYIRLAEVPFFVVKEPTPPIVPIFSLNLNLNFVFEVNFAAGISTRFVNLDSVQIGLCNDKEDGKLQTYKHKLTGADRYSLDVELCGYIGFRVGIEGTFGISFNGLDKLGEIGMSIEVGAYLDLYGYARLHLAKLTSEARSVYPQISGGLYIDIGIYTEVNVYAKSALFEVKAEGELIDLKFSLISIGDKDLLLYLEPYEGKIVMENDYIAIKDLENIAGTYIDLTTGELSKHEVIEWSDFECYSKNSNFKIEYNEATGEIEGIRLVSKTFNSVENYLIGKVYFTYQSSSLSFNSGLKAEITIIVPKDGVEISNIEAIGDVFTVNYYLSEEGTEPKLIGTKEVYGGNYAGLGLNFFDFKDCQKKHISIIYDKDPDSTPIVEDTTFTITTRLPLTGALFVYYDTETQEYVAEEYLTSLYEPLNVVDAKSNDDVTFVNWTSAPGAGNGLSFNNTSTELYLCDTDEFIANVNKSYALWYYDSYEVGQLIGKTTGKTAEEAINNFKRYGSYSYLGYIYTANYEYSDKTVTIHYQDELGNNKTLIETLPHGSEYTFKKVESPENKYLFGYSLTEHGNVNIYENSVVTVTENKEYYAVYYASKYSVLKQVWNESTRSFESIQYTLPHGTILDEEFLNSYQEGDKLSDGIVVGKVEGWYYYYLDNTSLGVNKLEENKVLDGSIYLYFSFERKVELTITAPNGATVLNEKVYTSDYPTPGLHIPKYEFYVTDYNIISYQDDYVNHIFKGYKDENGNFYEYQNTYEINTPTKLEAIYEDVPITYEVSIYSYPWKLDSGEYNLNLTINKSDIDEYIENFKEQYENREYENVTVDEHVYSFVEISIERKDDFKLVKITFETSASYIDCITTFIYDNGDENIVETCPMYTVYRSLVNPYYPTTSGLTATFLGWDTNEDGIVDIEPGGSYTVLKDNIVRAIWDLVYEEYEITFILDNDETNLGTYKYRVGETIIAPSLPSEYEGYKFSGWHTSDSYMPEVMPRHNLTVRGEATPCTVAYEIDGVAYKAGEFKKIGSKVTLIELPNDIGYTYSAWESEGITIEDGEFTMPEYDVVFTTHRVADTYNISFYIDNELVLEDTASYNTLYSVYVPNNHDDYVFMGWSSNDVIIKDGAFTVPLKNVRLDGYYEKTTVSPILLYYIDDELVEYTRCNIGDTITLITKEDTESEYFSGWVSDTDLILDNKLVVSKPVTIVYGTYSSGTYTIKFEIKDDEENIVYSYLIKGDEGETINVPCPNYLDDTGFIDSTTLEALDDDNYVIGSSDVTFTGSYTANANHEVNIEAYLYYYSVDTSIIIARTGSTVTLPVISRSIENSSIEISNWITSANIVLTYDDESDTYSFIMPDSDVYFYLFENYVGDDSIDIRLHVTYDGSEESTLIGTIKTYIGDHINSNNYNFKLDDYTLGSWHYLNGSGAGEFDTENTINGYDLYATYELMNVNIERCYLDGTLVRMFAKTNEDYVSPSGLNTNTLSQYTLPEVEGIDYMGWLNFINGYSSGKLYHYNPIAIDTDLYNYSYTIGDTMVEVLLYNESLYGNEPFFISLNIDGGEKIRLPLWDTELYDVSVVATKNGEDITLTLESDDLSQYVTLPSNITAEDYISISFYLTSK